MALGGSNDKLQGSTGGSTVSSSKPSRPTGSRPNSSSSSSSSSSKPINAYQQMAQAAQDANINNLSGTNTTKPDHYGDGSSTGEHNPNGVNGLPSSGGGGSSKPSKNAVAVTGPLADEVNKPDKPSAQDQYAQIVDDDYEWWQQNYLPLYYEALHTERGGNFDGDLQRANLTTGAAFDAAQGDVERAARGFGVNADIDQVKWDAMEASQKSGNRAALAPRVTQDQLSKARAVNEAGGPGTTSGRRLMDPGLDRALTGLEDAASAIEQTGLNMPWVPGMPGGPGAVSDKMMPMKEQWLQDGKKGYGVTTR